MTIHPIFTSSKSTHYDSFISLFPNSPRRHRSLLTLGTLFVATTAIAGQDRPAFAQVKENKFNITIRVNPTPKPVQTPTPEEKLALSIQQALGVAGVEVRVFTGKDGKTTAVLSGNLVGRPNLVKQVQEQAQKLKPTVVDNIVSLLLPPPPEPTPKPGEEAAARLAAQSKKEGEEEITAIYQRTFVSNSLTSTMPGANSSPSVSTTTTAKTESAGKSDESAATTQTSTMGSTTSESQSQASELANSLNLLYGGDAEKPLITGQGSGRFYLRGPRSKIINLQRDLLRIDAVRPQVQMDMWTVQVSGNPKKIATDMEWVRERFDCARKAMLVAQSILGDAAQKEKYFDKSDKLFDTDDKAGFLKRIGFDPNCHRPLSLTESLIFLALQTTKATSIKPALETDNSLVWGRKNSIYELQNELARVLNKNPELLKALHCSYKENGNENGQAVANKLFPALLASYSSDATSDRAGIVNFAKAAYNAYNPQEAGRSPKQQELDIATLRTNSAAGDRLLKAATDAFASDMQDMFLKPIFTEVARRTGSTSSGITLTGQARMVVTSRLETGIAPITTSYVDTTRPKPLGMDFLTGVLNTGGTAEASATPATTDATSAAAAAANSAVKLASVFTHLSNPQLLLLGAVMAQPEPEITRVSPGVAINVRPTVLPDGGAARLQLDFNFGVESEVMNTVTDKSGRVMSIPASGIKSNHVNTDITVSSFDLFNVSSFAIESSHPRSRYIPIIGSIPLLGELIKKPAKNTVTRHESIVLINTTILPRITDLTQFYGR